VINVLNGLLPMPILKEPVKKVSAVGAEKVSK
jgi:hypothetical protein